MIESRYCKPMGRWINLPNFKINKWKQSKRLGTDSLRRAGSTSSGTSCKTKKTRNQPFHSEFKQFVGEFLQEVTDQPELPAINDIFGYREAFLELIMEQISQSYTE